MRIFLGADLGRGNADLGQHGDCQPGRLGGVARGVEEKNLRELASDAVDGI